MANSDSLPPKAFDGQIFIDAFRVKWEFDGSTQCWVKVGQVADTPVATELQTGLLSAKLKQLLDKIPAGGGHFGIIAQPLLSLVPQNPTILFKGEVSKSIATESGTRINAVLTRDHAPEQFVGKVLIFKSGVLNKQAFLIFTNDENNIYIEGDASESQTGDRFEIISPTDLNPNGVLLGDIMLVSDSIDITCVDGDGLPLINDEQCGLDVIQCDNVNNPPGLNFEINSDFLDNLCVVIPGCKGAKGDRGDQGDPGLDGTGDGPQGETGDSGDDAPEVGHTFSGIKIVDIDDIYDTAVVSMELDAANGKLNIVRAKVRTPDSTTPATQLISTPINRSIAFNNSSSFDYDILKPNVDPISEVDVDIVKYPEKYGKSESGKDPRTTIVNKVKLSEVIDAVIAYYDEQLQEINNDYNQQLKTYIEAKDQAAREILAGLAHQVAECEFELPLDFCLGITPCGGASPSGGAISEPYDFALVDQVLDVPSGSDTTTASSLGQYSVPATSSSGSSGSSAYVPILYPNNSSSTATSTLPVGFYTIKIIPEGSAIRSNDTVGWLINSNTVGEGLEAVVTVGGTPTIVSGSVPSVDFDPLDKFSVERAYAMADFSEQIISIELTSSGTISLSAFVPGDGAQNAVNVEVLYLNAPEGAQLL